MGVAQVQVTQKVLAHEKPQIDSKQNFNIFTLSFRLWIFRLDQLRAGIVFFHRHQLLTPLYQVVNKAQI